MVGLTHIVRHSTLPGGLLALVLLVSPVHAQTSTVDGIAVDATTRQPVTGAVVMLAGTSHSTLTDARGAFTLLNVRPGTYTLRLSHIAFGEKTVQIDVAADEPTNVRLTVSPTALALEPLAVEVESVSALDQRTRVMGTRDGRVSRQQIAALEGRSSTLADVLQRHVPTVRIRRMENIAGSAICIELRAIRVSGVQPACLSPAVYLDGVPVNNPTSLYGSLNLETLESLEVVTAAESGVRFGSAALYGALLIETRRPGGANRRPQSLSALTAFDWANDTNQHPRERAFAYAFLGNAVGLALGFSTVRQCIRLRQPAEDAIVSSCDTWPTLGAALAAITLPAIGGAIGARLGGQTNTSRGQILPAAAGAVMTLLPGYALALTSQRGNSDALGAASIAVLTLGAPIAATIADKLFRSLRN